jgi:hypothetical protein
MSISKTISGLLLAVSLASCGGGGGDAQTPTSAGTAASTVVLTPASLDIVANTNSLSSGANASVNFIVTVKDANNLAIPSQPVVFTADSGTLTGANPTPVTNANGVITVVSLSAGSDVSNRTITVNAKSGNIVGSYSVFVTGSNLSVSGSGSMLLNSSTRQYTVKATDSNGKPIGNARLTVTSVLGNIAPETIITTDPSSGAATISYTPNNSGLDTLAVSGLGTSAKVDISVSSQDFSVNAISAIPVGVVTAVSATLKNSGGVGVPGIAIAFNTTRGVLSTPTAVTGSNGVATVNISSTSAGPFTLTATTGTATASSDSSFVGTTPATIVLQANPGTVHPNTDGGSANQSSLSVVVQDANANPVESQVVNFAVLQDISGGRISPGSSTTNKSGIATAQYIPGALSTPTNGVSLRATLASDSSLRSDASLTVSGSALFITIGVANTIIPVDATTYQKDFTVYVTDSSGTAVTGKQVTLSNFPRQYGKGSLEFSGAPILKWRYISSSPTLCPNEDTNKNGILDIREDFNSNGVLDPGLPVALSPSIVTTDQYGFANFSIRYGKNFAFWISTDITARALVGGTESSKTTTYDLEMLNTDATSSSSPPNEISPFGVATSCSNPN